VSFLIAAPELIADAATDLANIGSTICSANFAAAAATTGVLPAAADEVSAQIAALFSSHAAGYQQLSAQAEVFTNSSSRL
jgi:PE family